MLCAATALPLTTRQWLQDHAPSLDRTTRHASALLPLLARAGLLQAATDPDRSVDEVADVASESLTAGFVLYSQRSFIEVLRLTHNVALREHLLPAVEEGGLAGSTGLSGALGRLAHGTPLPVQGIETPRGWKLSGRLPWVPNLQHDGYAVVVPVAFEGMKDFAFVILGSEENGLTREPDFATSNLRSIRAAPLQLERVHFREDELLHVNGALLMPELLPSLLALQCGLALGVARAACGAAEIHAGVGALPDHDALERLGAVLQENRAALRDGLQSGRFSHDGPALVKLRARFIELAQAAVQLEQQAVGSEAVLSGEHGGCARRTAEVQFLSLLRPLAGDLQCRSSLVWRSA